MSAFDARGPSVEAIVDWTHATVFCKPAHHIFLVKMQQPFNETSTDRTQYSGVSQLELQVRYTTTLWGWAHDMGWELPLQRMV